MIENGMMESTGLEMLQVPISDIVKDVLMESFTEKKILSQWTTDDIVREALFEMYRRDEIRLDESMYVEILKRRAERIREVSEFLKQMETS